MNGALEILKRERDEATDAIRGLRSRIRDLEAAIVVLEGHQPDARPGRSNNIKQSVLELLASLRGKGATPRDLTDALVKLGYPTSEASVSSTLSRLKNDTKVTNREGRWFSADVSGQSTHERSEPKSSSWDDADDEVPF